MSTPQRIPSYQIFAGEAIPPWDFVQRWIPGVWTPVGNDGSSYLNGWRHYAGGDNINSPAVWRREGDCVAFSGAIDKNGGNFVTSEAMLQLPPEMRIPTSTRQFAMGTIAFGGGGSLGGVVLIYNVSSGILFFSSGFPTSGLASPVASIHLTGLRFPLI